MRVDVRDEVLDFEHLYRSQWHNMVRTALFLVDDVESARDCVQEAFIALHGRPLRDNRAQIAYLHRSVVNNARSMLRRRRTVRRHLHSAELPTVDGADREILVAAEQAALLDAVRQLPLRQREVLVLRYWSRLSEAEIAAALGIRPGTVKSTASRALAALESKLGDIR